jgi:uncharacterized protein YdaU (DUF1376 family)
MAEWMAFNPADYVTNTLHLTTRQHGGYILLICAAWAGKGVLPGTDAGLMAIAKLSAKEWREDGEALKSFLTRRGDVWVHERVEFEWKDAQSLIAAKSKAGREGARKRWQGRANDKPMAVPSQTQRQTDAPTPTPVPSPVVKGLSASHTVLESEKPAVENLELNGQRRIEPRHGGLIDYRNPKNRNAFADNKVVEVLSQRTNNADAWMTVFAARDPKALGHEKARIECESIARTLGVRWEAETKRDADQAQALDGAAAPAKRPAGVST